MKELRISTPTLAKVIELMLVIPSSTAELERFFKVLKEMKNKKTELIERKEPEEDVHNLPFLSLRKLR